MKKLIILSILTFSLLISCTNAEKKVNTKDNPTETAINPDNIVFLDVTVEGMTCTGCEASIKDGISELTGIVEVNSDFENGKTFVSYDSSLTSGEEISQAIEKRGYKVTSFEVVDVDAIEEL